VTRATVREVARRAGVSPMTVSRVINGNGRVRPETRVAVQQVIAAIGFVPNRLARGLSTRKTMVLGLIVPDVSNPFYAPIARGAESVARRAGYHVILCNSEGSLAYEGEYIADMLERRVDGLLVVPVSDESRANLRQLERHGIPYTLIDRAVPGIDADVVQGDSVGGARVLIQHLVSLGHTRIAILGEAQSVSTARDRRRGYCEALADAGTSPIPELMVETTADLLGGYRGMLELLALEHRPTAVFAINNLVAAGAVKAIRERGLKVPDDIALVAFDDIEHEAALSPFLTVMPQPAESFGTIAAHLLLDRILGHAPATRQVVVLPSEMIVRESCGAKGGRDGAIG
jgi:LacI family transcriptional regulator, galactose operon repressor